MHDSVDQQERADEYRQHHEIHRCRVREVDKAEKFAAGHRLNAVFAAGEGRLQAEKINHLGNRQRDHREIDALTTNCQQADDDAQQGGRQRARKDRHFRWPSPDLGGMGAHVAGRAQEHGVAERQQSAKAKQKIECTRKEREAQRLHQEHRIHAGEGRDGEHHHHQRGGDQHTIARRRRHRGDSGRGGGRRVHVSVPVRTNLLA